jgi:hypothetical protein
LEEAKQENSYWLGLLSSSERHGIPVERLLAREQRISSVDTAMLRESARRYVDGATRLQVVLYPEGY